MTLPVFFYSHQSCRYQLLYLAETLMDLKMTFWNHIMLCVVFFMHSHLGRVTTSCSTKPYNIKGKTVATNPIASALEL